MKKLTRKALARKRSNSRKRWKDVERRVAAALNEQLSDIGMSPIERIPILGREGPDLTVNETGLVINVKSRLVIPDRVFPVRNHVLHIGDLVCFRLSEIRKMSDPHQCHHTSTQPWKELTDWYEWMDKWTKECKPDGISAILLHHPRMPIGNIGIAIHINHLERLQCLLPKPQLQ